MKAHAVHKLSASIIEAGAVKTSGIPVTVREKETASSGAWHFPWLATNSHYMQFCTDVVMVTCSSKRRGPPLKRRPRDVLFGGEKKRIAWLCPFQGEQSRSFQQAER